MKTNFKIGDIISLDNNILNQYRKEIPSWYTPEILKIIGIEDSPFDDYQILLLNKKLPEHSNKICSFYVKLEIKTLRKEKLKKINENRR